MYRKRSRDPEIEEIIDGEIMEWDLEYFGWESTELLDPKQDHDHGVVLDVVDSTEANMTGMPDRGASSAAARASSSDCSGGASKRVIVGPGGAQKMSCSVDGCNADLSGCRDYHKRHRVCERHSKTPIVVVKGEEKRFCQQCSRFHSLGEFDEVKRSCRKRLDGHNRRRRKSQPEPLFFSTKNLLSGYKGSGPRMLQFGNPQITTTSVRTLWPLETKTGSETWLYSPHNKGFQFTNQASPQTWLKKDVTSPNWQPGSADQFRGRGKNDHHHITTMTTTTTTMSSSSSDEEIPLPIDSGGRALYLLSTNSAQPIEPVSFQRLDDRAVPDCFPTPYGAIANKTFISSYNNNHGGVYALRMGPESLL